MPFDKNVNDVTSNQDNIANQNTDVSSKDNTLTQDDLDRVVAQEKARLERKYKKDLAKNEEKTKKLEKTIRAGLGISDDEDVLAKLEDFYKEQGISIPNFEVTDEHDAEILGKSDADEFIQASDEKEIKERANELAYKQKKNKTTARENAEFYALGSYLKQKMREKELKESGIDSDILKDEKFKQFAKKFNSDIKLSEIFNVWAKMNGEKPQKPASTGSVRSTRSSKQEKEFYTPDEVDQLTSKDLDDPTIFARVRKSMTLWKKGV